MTRVFVQIQCQPGLTYRVGDAIAEREIHAALFSTSGEYDLMVELLIPEDQDVGRFINEHIHSVSGIVRTHTIMTFSTI